jgi:hypothetical protein
MSFPDEHVLIYRPERGKNIADPAKTSIILQKPAVSVAVGGIFCPPQLAICAGAGDIIRKTKRHYVFRHGDILR